VLTGWPVIVLSRGEVIVQDGKLAAERGRGRFLERAPSPALRAARPRRAGDRAT